MNPSEVRPSPSHHFHHPPAPWGASPPNRQRRHETESMQSALVPGLIAGAVQAVLFNPIDRALFLRVLHRRSFFCLDNWANPFQGFGNAALYRTLCGASYLVWQDVMRGELERRNPQLLVDSPVVAQLAIGCIAGTLNGLALNQLQIVKYQLWSTPLTQQLASAGGSPIRRNGVIRVAQEMLERGGVRVFFRGVGVSILRDSVFGMLYETIRRVRPPVTGCDFFWNLSAAVVASTATAPLNYCRNMIYGSPVDGSPLKVIQLLTQLKGEVMQEQSFARRASLVNARLNIGLGAFRVGVGMAVGQHIFDWIKHRSGHAQQQPLIDAGMPTAVPVGTE